MDNDTLAKVCKTVYSRNPNFSGVRPKVSKDIYGNTLMIFTTKGSLPGGKSLDQTLRVLLDREGKISKISSSR
jgi:hypothetical protein